MGQMIKKILEDSSLDKDAKIAKLNTILEDEVLKLTASEEGMGNDAESPIVDILNALHSLGVEVDVEHSPNQKDAILTKKIK
jgi:DNA polymerase I-like protein with 3'-5' exonuclease and polymerase domains